MWSRHLNDNTNPDCDLTIKQLRMALGMSAREFGAACGLTGRCIHRTVYRWEAGDQEPNGASRMLIKQLRMKLERRARR
jgi:DNA-binding transcriptional regulator YiaG